MLTVFYEKNDIIKEVLNNRSEMRFRVPRDVYWFSVLRTRAFMYV
jgi:hypothetical protein